jgi:hypothetical protein
MSAFLTPAVTWVILQASGRIVSGTEAPCGQRTTCFPPNSLAWARLHPLEEPPDETEFAVDHRYHRDRVFRLQHRADWNERPITIRWFLRGTYNGYEMGQDGTRLFCSYPCGLHFGVACWNADMRIKREQ